MEARLPDRLYINPEFASETIPSKELKQILLATGGKVIAKGRLRPIKSKSLGLGIYKVWLGDPENEKI